MTDRRQSERRQKSAFAHDFVTIRLRPVERLGVFYILASCVVGTLWFGVQLVHLVKWCVS